MMKDLETSEADFQERVQMFKCQRLQPLIKVFDSSS